MYNHQEYIDKNKSSEGKWRLPTVDELYIMYDRELDKPKIDGFSSDYYWSSIPYEDNTDCAWVVDFYNGDVNGDNKGNKYYVRCVNGMNDGLEWSKSSEKPMTWNEAMEYANELNN